MAFIGGALAVGIVGGFGLGVVLALASAGVLWEQRVPWMLQAHGWAQLEGWAGLFVAGMAFRLLPRFAGRHSPRKGLATFVFSMLFTGVVARTAGQLGAGDGISIPAIVVGQFLWAGGAFALSLAVLVIVARGRHRNAPWSLFALTGAGWWAAWGATSIAAGLQAAGNEGYVPNSFDQPMTWMVMLGAVGNFIWAVQSRSVPIFFGRKAPGLRVLLAPGLLLNGGVALLFVAGWFLESAGVWESYIA